MKEPIDASFLCEDYGCADELYADEKWAVIDGIPDYMISTHGRVYSYISDKYLYGSPTGRCGHIDVSMRVNNVRVHRYMHRMVAEAFIPNPHYYPLVRHLNGDTSDNTIDNLAWGTQVDNMRDCIENGDFYYLDEDDLEKACQKRRTPIIATNLKTGEETMFISQQEASRVLEVSQSSIHQIISNKPGRHTAKGYTFRYSKKRGSI